MKPYYAAPDGQALYLGDCRQVLAELPAESVDACVTDPPYELTSKHGARSPQFGEGGKAHYGERVGGFMGNAWEMGLRGERT